MFYAVTQSHFCVLSVVKSTLIMMSVTRLSAAVLLMIVLVMRQAQGQLGKFIDGFYNMHSNI